MQKKKKIKQPLRTIFLHTTSHYFYPLSAHSGIWKLTLHVKKKKGKVIYNIHTRKTLWRSYSTVFKISINELGKMVECESWLNHENKKKQ